jgi:adenylyl cyclase-associated protein
MFPAPNVTLEDKRWYVENFHNDPQVILKDIEITQSVFINKCTESTISIERKSKGVTVNNCNKTNVVVQDVIAKFELIRCKSVAIQVNGTCGTIDLDSCEDVQIYLASAEALGCEIFTAQCRNVNVLVMDAQADGEFRELSIPSLYQTRYCQETGKLQTVPFTG